MGYVYNQNSRSQLVKVYGGGKGYNLFLLANQNFRVPSFQIISSQAFTDFIIQNELQDQIESHVEKAKSDMGVEKADEIHAQIEKIFLEASLPDNISKAIVKAFTVLDEKTISVRSSAAGEDSALHSFAGQLSSFLYLSKVEDVKVAVKKCWASGFSGRSLSYRLNKGLSVFDIQVAVVMQEMIDPDISGVIFTQNLIENNPNEVIVSSVYGVGEGIVSGALDADTFYYNRETKELREEIAEKSSKFVADENAPGLCKEVRIDEAEKASLSGELLNEVVHLALDIEKYYLFPQDIEFAVVGSKVFVLQSRPITNTSGQAYLQQGQVIVWDNSNIIESYPGISSPLTFSFASHIYGEIYKQTCRVLGVAKDKIESSKHVLRNMLGIIDGRIFYNLVNWYKLLSLMPGFKNNKSFMETMLGVSEKMPEDVIQAMIPEVEKPTLKTRYAHFKAFLRAVWTHLLIDRIIAKFFKKFWRIYNDYISLNYLQMTTDQIVKHYVAFRDKMINNWQEPVMNDILIMFHFGVLKKMTEKWCKDLGENIQNDLLSGQGGIESAEPTLRIVELCSYVVKHEKLHKMVSMQSPDYIFEEIKQQAEYAEFNALVEEYLRRFGFRCMGELKLEEKDLNNNPGYLFTMMKNYLRTGNTSVEEFVKNEKKLCRDAEAKINKHLGRIKKMIYYWSLRNTRRAVKNRENTRFARTRFFGIVRKMFQAVGEDLFRKSIILHPDDVFYLTEGEIIAYAEGRAMTQKLSSLIALRREEYEEYHQKEDPCERFFTRGIVYVGNNWHEEESIDEDLPENMLRGLPCAPGSVEGKVKVILSPNDDLDLNGEILVTARTDPGWVPIYPSISGLAIARGSLLSHSAIVARELSIPTVIKVKGLLDKIHSGDYISLDGTKGMIEIGSSTDTSEA